VNSEPRSFPPLEVGDPAPVVDVCDQSGRVFSLGSLYVKGPVLIFFYPKADTPGCTREACGLRDRWEQLQAKGVEVLGVSADSPRAQRKFQEKYALPFPLIPDPQGKVIEPLEAVLFDRGWQNRLERS
jgi:peroxiredoxin Q/BCP